MKIRRVGAELFPAKGYTATGKLILLSHNFAKPPQKATDNGNFEINSR